MKEQSEGFSIMDELNRRVSVLYCKLMEVSRIPAHNVTVGSGCRSEELLKTWIFLLLFVLDTFGSLRANVYLIRKIARK